MRQSFRNPIKECIGCDNPQIWDIFDITAACFQVKKFIEICPCKNCLVKVTCQETCPEKEKARKLYKELKEKDVTYFSVKKKRRRK